MIRQFSDHHSLNINISTSYNRSILRYSRSYYIYSLDLIKLENTKSENNQNKSKKSAFVMPRHNFSREFLIVPKSYLTNKLNEYDVFIELLEILFP